jgi:Mn2+/Fe2+ NRAMP family transporter
MTSVSTLLAHGLPLACSGHLLIDLPIFMGPVLLLVGWLLVMTRKARRSERISNVESAHAPEQADEIRNALMGVHA